VKLSADLRKALFANVLHKNQAVHVVEVDLADMADMVRLFVTQRFPLASNVNPESALNPSPGGWFGGAVGPLNTTLGTLDDVNGGEYSPTVFPLKFATQRFPLVSKASPVACAMPLLTVSVEICTGAPPGTIAYPLMEESFPTHSSCTVVSGTVAVRFVPLTLAVKLTGDV
jgi:hypothetical protein